MKANYEGMDVDQVESLGRQLDSQASNLGELKRTLDNLVLSMANNWDGADSQRFNDSWHGTYSGQVTEAINNLRALSNTALRQASEQTQASA